MKYFSNAETLEELKKEYKKMVLKLHPDKGGDVAEFKKMQAEFEEAVKILAAGEQNWKRHQKADGTQKTVDELLKEAGLHWAKKKLAWYWHAEGWVRKSRREFSLNEIRTMHGSETIRSGEYTKIGVPPVPPTTNHYHEQVLF